MQDKIKKYEEHMGETDVADLSPKQLVAMENEVAKMSAQVAQSDQEVYDNVELF